VLSICFDPAIDKMILTCQNAFIKGRNVMDGVMSVHEILHESRIKKQQGVVFTMLFMKKLIGISFSIV
jgi:hypothetical protein